MQYAKFMAAQCAEDGREIWSVGIPRKGETGGAAFWNNFGLNLRR